MYLYSVVQSKAKNDNWSTSKLTLLPLSDFRAVARLTFAHRLLGTTAPRLAELIRLGGTWTRVPATGGWPGTTTVRSG